MVRLTVRRVGDSLGVTLPAEAAQTLHARYKNALRKLAE